MGDEKDMARPYGPGSHAAHQAQGLGPSGFDPSRDVVIPRSLYHFLMGEAQFDGVWFDELDRGLPGRFWWRALLSAAARDSDRSGEAVETTGSTVGESAGPQDIAQTEEPQP